jgi:DNA (cytosine-5)-methyltransferase 1
MNRPIAIVDLFSGPGGLGEGFSAHKGADGQPRYEIAVSIEKEASAHSTRLLRAFMRKLEGGYPQSYYDFLNGRIKESDWALLYPREWAAAEAEARHLELGTPETARSQPKEAR